MAVGTVAMLYRRAGYCTVILPTVPNSVGVSWAMTAKHDIPQTFTDAMNRSDSDCWLKACSEELGALKETRTYVTVSIDDVDPYNIVGC